MKYVWKLIGFVMGLVAAHYICQWLDSQKKM